MIEKQFGHQTEILTVELQTKRKQNRFCNDASQQDFNKVHKALNVTFVCCPISQFNIKHKQNEIILTALESKQRVNFTKLVQHISYRCKKRFLQNNDITLAFHTLNSVNPTL